MSFIWPVALIGLLFVPLTIALYVYLGRRNARAEPNATLGAGYRDVSTLGWKRHVSPCLLYTSPSPRD